MRILLVEDTEDLAGALQKHLRSTGHTVDWAQNLHAARQFWIVEQAAYDVIVLDIELPDGSGLTLLHQIRQSERSVGVLMLTARADIEDKVQVLDSGADDYLTKPCALEELDARIRSVARRHLTRPQNVRLVGRLAYDPTNRTVWADEHQVQLRTQELKLFEALIESSGWTASKEQLQSHLYGLDQEGSNNAVEVHVSRLRPKLSLYGLAIQTLRGLGYRLIETDNAE